MDQVLPAPKLAAYGFQHVLAFYAGAVLVPILVAGALGLTEQQLIHLINADLFTCRIASIIQAVGFGRGWFRFGIQLPLLQGVTFTAVSPMIAIGTAVIAGGGTPVDGLLTIYGAVLVAGLFTMLVAPFFARLLKLLPAGRHRLHHPDHRCRTDPGRGGRHHHGAIRGRTASTSTAPVSPRRSASSTTA